MNRMVKDVPDINVEELISRQAVMVAVKDALLAWSSMPEWRDNKVLEAIIGLPSAQPERKWVPLDSGRFPDDSGTYIVTAYDGAKERVTFAKYQKRLKRWELTGARAYWRVLAWMSLPTPYEERREE